MPKDFLRTVLQNNKDITANDAAIAFLWRCGMEDPAVNLSTKELADAIETAGNARPNVTRLKQSLTKDSRTAKAANDTFKIKISAREGLDSQYIALLNSRPLKRSNAVLPLDLLKNANRKYLNSVALQLNLSYEHGLFDCCAVMCRRILETLIIEVFEHKGLSTKITGTDGHYIMLAGLVKAIETEPSTKLGRNALKGLKAIKDLGDKSAHNRRFNARKEDIDPISSDLRTAVEELLHLANLS